MNKFGAWMSAVLAATLISVLPSSAPADEKLKHEFTAAGTSRVFEGSPGVTLSSYWSRCDAVLLFP